MQPVPSTATKTYPARGPLQQFRFADRVAFDRFRCRQTNTSKLITVRGLRREIDDNADIAPILQTLRERADRICRT